MNYKHIGNNEENFGFLTRSNIDQNKTIITDDELPEYLEFSHLYDFITYNCVEFVKKFEADDLIKVNNILKELFSFFESNKEKLASANIDYSRIIKIFCETMFMNSFYSAIRDKGADYIPNCAAFITCLTYLSDAFNEVLAKEDFITPLTNYYMENYNTNNLTDFQKINIVTSINNQIQYYPDKKFSVFFDNKDSGNFYKIFDAFKKIMPTEKLLKFIYLILINGNEIEGPIYINILEYFNYILKAAIPKIPFIRNGENEEEQSELEKEQKENEIREMISIFNLSLLLMRNFFKLLLMSNFLKEDTPVSVYILRSGILHTIYESYIENQSELKPLKNIIINYYRMIILAMKCKKKLEEAEAKFDIYNLIINVDIDDMIKDDDCDINSCVLDLVLEIIEQKNFENFFKEDSITITECIIDKLDESSFNIKKKAFKCLYYLIKSNFDAYAETIVKEIETSFLYDLIESGEDFLQKKVFNLIRIILRQSVNTTTEYDQESLKKSFALDIYEDDDLFECIQTFSCPHDNKLEVSAKIANHLIEHWVNN